MNFKFGWSNPNGNLNRINNYLIDNERENIIEIYLYQTVFLTRYAGNIYRRYRNLDFEVMNITFNNIEYPLVPTLLLVHNTDDPRNPNNIITISLDLLNENMIRM